MIKIYYAFLLSGRSEIYEPLSEPLRYFLLNEAIALSSHKRQSRHMRLVNSIDFASSVKKLVVGGTCQALQYPSENKKKEKQSQLRTSSDPITTEIPRSNLQNDCKSVPINNTHLLLHVSELQCTYRGCYCLVRNQQLNRRCTR